MKHTHKVYTKLGFLICAFAVILGAFGAHLLKEKIGENELKTFETGVKYQFYHALAILVLSINYRKFDSKYLQIALSLFFLGIILFSGSLYLLSTINLWGSESFKFIGAITPIGGLSFISGWLILFFKGFSKDEGNKDSVMGIFEEENKAKRKHRQKSYKNSSPETQE
ncbi:MAG: DUF423 domain-containing protein [Bacteroidia bacterium]|nr:DUF423 domain-containing protein [Bacteroidia bacterium]MCF8425514.1 DUF423 domain-containing protein [Bacteroidia bacterium]MCF8446944.1 DUF423 domain-containing protein [Bacteroidia bacterium]